MNNTFFKYAGLVALVQTIEAASLRNHDSDAAVKKNLSHTIVSVSFVLSRDKRLIIFLQS